MHVKARAHQSTVGVREVLRALGEREVYRSSSTRQSGPNQFHSEVSKQGFSSLPPSFTVPFDEPNHRTAASLYTPERETINRERSISRITFRHRERVRITAAADRFQTDPIYKLYFSFPRDLRIALLYTCFACLLERYDNQSMIAIISPLGLNWFLDRAHVIERTCAVKWKDI